MPPLAPIWEQYEPPPMPPLGNLDSYYQSYRPNLHSILTLVNEARQSFTPSCPAYVGRKKCGSINIPEGTKTPLQFFCLFFTFGLLNSIAEATNIYGKSKYGDKWIADVSLQDLRIFMAVTIYFGLVKIPVRRLAWSKSSKFFLPWVANLISRDRFEQILTSLHIERTHDLSEAQRKEKNRANPYWTWQPFLDHLSEVFQKYWRIFEFMSIDEMCIFFTGRFFARCYNPNKPFPYHFKAFCLNCAFTGYLLDFYMYAGASENRPNGM
jgi:hypothetical protein